MDAAKNPISHQNAGSMAQVEPIKNIPRNGPVAAEVGPVQLNFRVSEDKLQVYLSIHPPIGLANGDLDAEYVFRRFLETGIDPENLYRSTVRDQVEEWQKTHASVAERLVAESSCLPEKGKDAWIEYLVDPNLKVSALEEAGTIDFKNLNLVKPVSLGQALACKHIAENGVPGIDLFGRPCTPESGADIVLPIGLNTEVSATDPLVLVAKVAGFLQVKDELLTVNECFIVEGGVDYSTGNIVYEQSAIIRGDIADGFTLTIGGALEVGGAVGESKLIVGGDVLIKQGFVGSGQGLITAKGNVNLGFTSNQNLRAHGNIGVGKESFNCQIFSRKSVVVIGSLVGGQTIAMDSISCRIAGNELGTKTEIEVGMDYILAENKRLLEEKVLELTAHLGKISMKLKAFREIYRDRKRFSASEAKMMLDLRDMQERIQAGLPELEKRKQKIILQIREGYKREGMFIRVEKKVHPGVVIKIGNELMRIQEALTGPKIFAYRNGRIQVV
jgi:uncharacterized protein